MKRKETEYEVEFILASAIAEAALLPAGLGDIAVIESKLVRVLDLDPTNIEALNLLAQLYAQTRRHKKAFGCFARFFSMAVPTDVLVKLTLKLAETYEAIHEFEKATSVYQKTLSKVEDASLYNGIGYCYSKTLDLDKALDSSQRAVELDPKNALYINDLGYALLEVGDLDAAKNRFEEALTIDPHYELARGNLAYCKELMLKKKKSG